MGELRVDQVSTCDSSLESLLANSDQHAMASDNPDVKRDECLHGMETYYQDLKLWHDSWKRHKDCTNTYISSQLSESDMNKEKLAKIEIFKKIDPESFEDTSTYADRLLLSDCRSLEFYIATVLMGGVVECETASQNELTWVISQANSSLMRTIRSSNPNRLCGESSATIIYTLLVLQLRALTRLKAYDAAYSLLKYYSGNTRLFPPLEASSPVSQASFHYFEGIYHVASNSLVPARSALMSALTIASNYAVPELQQRILIYLVPVMAASEQLRPSYKLYEEYPLEKKLYEPLMKSIVRGNVSQFNEHLNNYKHILVSNRLYIVVTALWNLCIACLMCRVQRVLQSSRIDMDIMDKALEWSGYFKDLRSPSKRKASQVLLIAQLINAGHVRGYVAPEQGLIVLSKTNPFPTLRRPISNS